MAEDQEEVIQVIQEGNAAPDSDATGDSSQQEATDQPDTVDENEAEGD